MAVLKEFAQPLNTIFVFPLHSEIINLKLFPQSLFQRKEFKYVWYSNNQLQIVPKLRGLWACEGQNNVARVNSYTLRTRDDAQRAEMRKKQKNRRNSFKHPSTPPTPLRVTGWWSASGVFSHWTIHHFITLAIKGTLARTSCQSAWRACLWNQGGSRSIWRGAASTGVNQYLVFSVQSGCFRGERHHQERDGSAAQRLLGTVKVQTLPSRAAMKVIGSSDDKLSPRSLLWADCFSCWHRESDPSHILCSGAFTLWRTRLCPPNVTWIVAKTR